MKNELEFRAMDAYSPDAAMLMEELNEVLTGIVGNSGTRYVHLDDFAMDRAVFLIGYDAGEPVCCAGIRCFDAQTGEIKRVYARKNAKGYAAQLMRALEGWALANGYGRLILECREINRHAIGFYARCGYAICEKYPPYEDQADAVCMEKRIGAGC